MIELYVYSTMMSPGNQSVFQLLKEVTFGSVLSLFCSFFLRQLCSPLFGFFWFAPGFVEAHQLTQRFNGAEVFRAELGCAAVEGVQEQSLGVLVAALAFALHTLASGIGSPSAKAPASNQSISSSRRVHQDSLPCQ